MACFDVLFFSTTTTRRGKKKNTSQTLNTGARFGSLMILGLAWSTSKRILKLYTAASSPCPVFCFLFLLRRLGCLVEGYFWYQRIPLPHCPASLPPSSSPQMTPPRVVLDITIVLQEQQALSQAWKSHCSLGLAVSRNYDSHLCGELRALCKFVFLTETPHGPHGEEAAAAAQRAQEEQQAARAELLP